MVSDYWMMNMRIMLIALTSILLTVVGFCNSTAAVYNMYKWVDKDGIIHMEDAPPQDLSKSTKVEKITSEGRTTSNGPQRTQPTRNQGQKQTRQSAATVEIYTAVWCPYCTQAKEYLRSRGIAYREYDIDKDKEALKRKNELVPNGGVPVAVINGKVISGFSSNAYDRVLAGHP